MKIKFVSLNEDKKSNKPPEYGEYITIYSTYPTDKDWVIGIKDYETVYLTWSDAIKYAKRIYGDVLRVEKRYKRICVPGQEWE